MVKKMRFLQVDKDKIERHVEIDTTSCNILG